MSEAREKKTPAPEIPTENAPVAPSPAEQASERPPITEAAAPAPKPEDNLETVEGIFAPDNKDNGNLVSPKSGGRIRPSDPFISREIAKKYKLKVGSYIVAKARHDARFPNPKVMQIVTVDGLAPEKRLQRIPFTQLTSVAPDEMIKLESKDGRLTTRIVDLFCPIGKGTRGLIVAPPRTGKTTLLKDIAVGVLQNHPECTVMILLVDERPEEVTDFRRDLPEVELYASSNDEEAENHIRVAEFCIERAKRLVETGKHVVLLVDSITRLTRSYNNARVGSGRTMTGGLDSRAMEKPRQLFSSARNTEDGGSLTIVASALVKTGSRMDDLIFEEFKGTGNMEMVLDRKVAELRIWPAFDLAASGTRKEELILPEHYLDTSRLLRRAMTGGKIEDIAEAMTDRLAKTKTNADFIRLINRG